MIHNFNFIRQSAVELYNAFWSNRIWDPMFEINEDYKFCKIQADFASVSGENEESYIPNFAS